MTALFTIPSVTCLSVVLVSIQDYALFFVLFFLFFLNRKPDPISFEFLWKISNTTGNSGTGRYHGKYTFDQLSHLRSCLIKNLNMERLNLIRYPPHTAQKLRWARMLLIKQVNMKRWRNLAHIAMLAALAAFVVQVCFT